jgi:hypothetical protein
MRTTAFIQTSGTLAVIGAFAAADGTSRLLAVAPDSELLWQIQIGMLSPFRALFYRMPSALSGVLTANLTLITASALLVTIAAFAMKQRLAMAVLANCAAVLVAAVSYLWTLGAIGLSPSASLAGAVGTPGPDIVLLVLLGTVSAAAAAGHWSFIRSILDEA